MVTRFVILFNYVTLVWAEQLIEDDLPPRLGWMVPRNLMGTGESRQAVEPGATKHDGRLRFALVRNTITILIFITHAIWKCYNFSIRINYTKEA